MVRAPGRAADSAGSTNTSAGLQNATIRSTSAAADDSNRRNNALPGRRSSVSGVAANRAVWVPPWGVPRVTSRRTRAEHAGSWSATLATSPPRECATTSMRSSGARPLTSATSSTTPTTRAASSSMSRACRRDRSASGPSRERTLEGRRSCPGDPPARGRRRRAARRCPEEDRWRPGVARAGWPRRPGAARCESARRDRWRGRPNQRLAPPPEPPLARRDPDVREGAPSTLRRRASAG